MLSYILHSGIVQDTRHELLFTTISYFHISYFLLQNNLVSDQDKNINSISCEPSTDPVLPRES